MGLALTLCAVAFLSRFILVIEVSGNEQVPTAVILSQLRQLGVRPGVYGPSLDRQQIAQEALLELEGLSWMGINLHGTRAGGHCAGGGAGARSGWMRRATTTSRQRWMA